MKTSTTPSEATNVGFLRVGGGGLVESVTDRLTEAVRIGFLSPGEQLPPETVLAQQLEVSTVTLREALATLRSRGLIETRRGRNGGSFICERSATTTAVLRSRLASHAIADIRDLGDEWLAVFSTAAMLAASRADDAGIDRMTRLINQLRNETTVDGRARTLSKIHIEVALASQSERLTRSELRLQSEISDIFWTPPPATADLQRIDIETVAEECQAIVCSLQAEDPAGARQAAETRIRSAIDRLVAVALSLQS